MNAITHAAIADTATHISRVMRRAEQEIANIFGCVHCRISSDEEIAEAVNDKCARAVALEKDDRRSELLSTFAVAEISASFEPSRSSGARLSVKVQIVFQRSVTTNNGIDLKVVAHAKIGVPSTERTIAEMVAQNALTQRVVELAAFVESAMVKHATLRAN